METLFLGSSRAASIDLRDGLREGRARTGVVSRSAPHILQAVKLPRGDVRHGVWDTSRHLRLRLPWERRVDGRFRPFPPRPRRPRYCGLTALAAPPQVRRVRLAVRTTAFRVAGRFRYYSL